MRRNIAIPDIHGCNITFRKLLFDIVGLTRDDTLFLLGDYIDRGPDSKGVIDGIMGLQGDGYDVRPVLGNHEDMLLKCIESGSDEDLWVWLENGGDATLRSYGVRHPRDIDPEHLIFMGRLPLFHDTSSHVFVHAGLNFRLRDPLSARGRESMLWQRTDAANPAKIGGRKVVSGHTILDIDQIRERVGSSHIRLDNGCFTGGGYPGMGSLIALEVETGTLHVQENSELRGVPSEDLKWTG